MTDPLVEVIAGAPCLRPALKHRECEAAAVRSWLGEVVDEEWQEWNAPDGGDEAREALDHLRRRLVGEPGDVHVCPAVR